MIETPRLLQSIHKKNLPAFKFTLPAPYCEWQRVLMTSDVKFAMFICGSKAGKTLAGACKIIHASYCAPKNQQALYRIIAPTYALTSLTYDYICRLCPDQFEQRPGQNAQEYLRSLEAWNSIKPIKTPSKMKMMWPHNGAVIQCTHAQDPEVTIEGARTAGNILDELAKMKEGVLSSVQSTTFQTEGFIRGYTTPRGKGWVYKKFMECKNEMELAKLNNRKPTMIALTATTLDNPFVSKEALAFAKRTLPERLYKQLILAEWVDNGSTFSGFRQLLNGPEITIEDAVQIWVKPGSEDVNVIMGGDWARKTDFTVVTAWNPETREMIGFMRFHHTTYKQMVKHVYDFGKRFGDVTMLKHDKTGIGDVIDELLQQLPWPIDGVVFTNENKAAMISQFMIDMEHQKFTLPNWTEMVAELDAYEVNVNPLGKMIYGAPSGLHDDIVSSMFLAWSAVVEFNPGGFDVQFLDQLNVNAIDSYYDSLLSDDD